MEPSQGTALTCHGQLASAETGLLWNFRTNWVFSPDEWEPHHIIGIHTALLTHMAGLSGEKKKEALNLRHSLGTAEYHFSSSLTTGLQV